MLSEGESIGCSGHGSTHHTHTQACGHRQTDTCMEADIDRHILAGKTAAFLLPMISVIIKSPTPAGQGNGRSSWPRGLILAPTRELVQQIFDEVCVCVCVSSTHPNYSRAAYYIYCAKSIAAPRCCMRSPTCYIVPSQAQR
jgi:hypothetical protein